MAEAHAAVAFSFSVTPEGQLDFAFNWFVIEGAVRAIGKSFKKKVMRFRNGIVNGLYPLKPVQWLTFLFLILGLSAFDYDISLGLIEKLSKIAPIRYLSELSRFVVSAIIFAAVVWYAFSWLIRVAFRCLLMYKGWMYDTFGKPKWYNVLYLNIVKFLSHRRPLLKSFQGALPSLPVPPLDDTIKRYLISVRALHTDTEHEEMTKLAEEFRTRVGRRLQRYLWLKWLISTNYVSDWWEQYVYLKGRGPIMVNSNFYAIDIIKKSPTPFQAARAANLTHFALKFRQQVDREEIQPIYVSNCIPLCSSQYERQFNTVREPGEDIDKLVHYDDSHHIVVYHRGRYFKLICYSHGRLMQPNELELAFQAILDDPTEPAEGELHLAALTAGSRTPWAQARKHYFSEGVNKTSLREIDRAAFMVSLDDDEYRYDPNDHKHLDKWARAMLHGKCHDRWFDKSFNLIVGTNGACGFNGEHSWADAPIMGHLWEHLMGYDAAIIGYAKDGHCTGGGNGKAKTNGFKPVRLHFEIVPACQAIIEKSLAEAQKLAGDVDTHLVDHTVFGKGAMKKCRISPDAFIQMALQLAHFRDQGNFCLTYESSMTRLYCEGRTETVRSCTVESAAFVRAMENPTETKEARAALLREAAEKHQSLYRAAMSGQGIDRHLFTLYVVSRWLGVDSPFLNKVLSEPWRLSTSQTPTNQTNIIDINQYPDLISPGGGFGPVADDGYGISYIIVGENFIMFHVSSKKSCPKTDSKRMGDNIRKAMADMRALFDSPATKK